MTHEGIEIELHQIGGSAVAAASITARHRAQRLQAPSDRGGKALLAADIGNKKDIVRGRGLVGSMGSPKLLQHLLGRPCELPIGQGARGTARHNAFGASTEGACHREFNTSPTRSTLERTSSVM